MKIVYHTFTVTSHVRNVGVFDMYGGGVRWWNRIQHRPTVQMSSNAPTSSETGAKKHCRPHIETCYKSPFVDNLSRTGSEANQQLQRTCMLFRHLSPTDMTLATQCYTGSTRENIATLVSQHPVDSWMLWHSRKWQGTHNSETDTTRRARLLCYIQADHAHGVSEELAWQVGSWHHWADLLPVPANSKSNSPYQPTTQSTSDTFRIATYHAPLNARIRRIKKEHPRKVCILPRQWGTLGMNE